jgi:polyisoprenoid-binding protein YceI
MIRSHAFALLVSTAIVAVAPAGMAAAPVSRIAKAPTQAWTVDMAHSRLGFRGATEGTAFEGNFRRWNARINFDPKKLATSSVVVSVDTGSAFTGNQDRDQTLPTDDWFSIKHFPTATFVSTRFVDQGKGHYQAIGDLTIKGIKRPVTLPFTLAINGDAAQVSGTLPLNRTAFNVGAGKWKTPDEVGTTVTVVITLAARKAR